MNLSKPMGLNKILILILFTMPIYADDYVKFEKESAVRQIKKLAQKDSIDLAYQNIKLKRYINHQKKVIEEQKERIGKLKELLEKNKKERKIMANPGKNQMNKFPAILNTAYRILQYASCDILASEIREIQKNYGLDTKKIDKFLFMKLSNLRREKGNIIFLDYLIDIAKGYFFVDVVKDLEDLKRAVMKR